MAENCFQHNKNVVAGAAKALYERVRGSDTSLDFDKDDPQTLAGYLTALHNVPGLSKYSTKTTTLTALGNQFRPVSEVVSPVLLGKLKPHLDAYTTARRNSDEAAATEAHNTIKSMASKALKNLTAGLNNSDPTAQDAFVTQLMDAGVTVTNIGVTKTWLRHLATGGLTKQSDNILYKVLAKADKNLTKHTATNNVNWTMNNIMGDVGRIVAHYGDKNPLVTAKTVTRALTHMREKTGGNPLVSIEGKELDVKAYDIFSLSRNFNTNLAMSLSWAKYGEYRLDDVDRALLNTPEWDTPAALLDIAPDNTTRGILKRFTTFALADGNYTFNVYKKALDNRLPKEERLEAVAHIMNAAAYRYITGGAKAALGVPLGVLGYAWKFAGGDEDDFKEMEANLNLPGSNLVGNAVNTTLHAAGSDMSVDVSEYAQPYWNVFGIGSRVFQSGKTLVGAAGDVPENIKMLMEGKPTDAALAATATTLSVLGVVSSFDFYGINSKQASQVAGAVLWGMSDNQDRSTGDIVAKAAFGKEAKEDE